MAEARSFRDSLKLVMENSNAMKKNAVGMTPDAQKFKDLHKVQDAGVKHMVQKDSETADYEKMFKPDIGVAKSRLADLHGDESEKQYTQANEEAVEEETVNEAGGASGGFVQHMQKQSAAPRPIAAPAPVAPSRGLPQNQAQAIKQRQAANAAGTPAKPAAAPVTIAAKPVVPTGGNSAGASGTRPPVPTAKPASQNMNKPVSAPVNGVQQQKVAMVAANDAAKTTVPKPTAKPESQNMNKPVERKMKSTSGLQAPVIKPAAGKAKAAKPQAAKVKPQAAKPVAAKPAKRAGLQSKTQRDGLAMNQSYEIEIDGNTYNLSETHMAAVAAFIEKYALVESDYIEEDDVEEIQESPTHTDRLKESLNVYFSKKNR